jgi:hypothetical protein
VGIFFASPGRCYVITLSLAWPILAASGQRYRHPGSMVAGMPSYRVCLRLGGICWPNWSAGSVGRTGRRDLLAELVGGIPPPTSLARPWTMLRYNITPATPIFGWLDGGGLSRTICPIPIPLFMLHCTIVTLQPTFCRVISPGHFATIPSRTICPIPVPLFMLHCTIAPLLCIHFAGSFCRVILPGHFAGLSSQCSVRLLQPTFCRVILPDYRRSVQPEHSDHPPVATYPPPICSIPMPNNLATYLAQYAVLYLYNICVIILVSLFIIIISEYVCYKGSNGLLPL